MVLYASRLLEQESVDFLGDFEIGVSWAEVGGGLIFPFGYWILAIGYLRRELSHSPFLAHAGVCW